jgi:hypothetical protein
MTTINPHNRTHAGIWHRTTHALGTLWATVLALPDASGGATRRKAPPTEYFNFPPF